MALFGQRAALKVVEIPVGQICPNPNQPRKAFAPETLAQLAKSIEQSGLLQPIIVRALDGGRYELIAGERRLRAVQLLERSHISAIIRTADQQESSVLALLENIQREDLSFFEEAFSYRRLLETQGLSQQQLADKLGKNQSTIANKLRLLKIPPTLMEKILDYHLTERHARAIIKIIDLPEADKLVDYIGKHQLNVTQTEKYLEGILAQQANTGKKTTWLVQDVRIFANSIQKAIDVMKGAGIHAVSTKKEDEHSLTYIVTIPKNIAYKPIKESKRLSG